MRKRLHGESSGANRTKEYRVWYHIKSRCTNIKDKSYDRYGGRGIKMCERWLTSYSHFLLDMGRAPSPEHSIERKNNDKDYEPSNCKWATPLEQANNKRNTFKVEYNGKVKSLHDWCRELNLNFKRVDHRIRRGWCVKEAFEDKNVYLSNKLNNSDVSDIRLLHQTGVSMTFLSKKYNVSHTTISQIIRKIIWRDSTIESLK